MQDHHRNASKSIAARRRPTSPLVPHRYRRFDVPRRLDRPRPNVAACAQCSKQDAQAPQHRQCACVSCNPRMHTNPRFLASGAARTPQLAYAGIVAFQDDVLLLFRP